MIIDFTNNDKTLFTGVTNGRSMGKHLIKVTPTPLCLIKSRDDQVITSSFFIGLLENILKHYTCSFGFKMHWDYYLNSDSSRSELERALVRYFRKEGL